MQRLASAAVELLCRIARFHALMELAFCAAPKVRFSSVQARGWGRVRARGRARSRGS